MGVRGTLFREDLILPPPTPSGNALVVKQQQNIKTLSKKQTVKHLWSFPENFFPLIIILPLFREPSRLEVSGFIPPTP